jgi:hypothetical protein
MDLAMVLGAIRAGVKDGVVLKVPAWQRERDRILRAAGFVDLENEQGEIESLSKTSHAAIIGRGRTHQEIETLAEYYREAGRLLHEHKFKSPVERRIWELHADGTSYTRIWRTVKREIDSGELPRERMYRRRVHAVVARLRSVFMGGAEAQKRGRKRDQDSMRSHGLAVVLRLTPAHFLALDHVRTRLQISRSEAVRRALAMLEKSIR